MCCHGRPVRVPCQDCADSYHRLIKIDTVDTLAADALSFIVRDWAEQNA